MSYYTCLSSQDGDSALMRAASWGRTDVVVEMIKAKANLNLQNEVLRLSMLIYTAHDVDDNWLCVGSQWRI